MNDFLQNLRAAQADKQRAGKKRKNYDNGFNYAAHSRQGRFQSYGPTRQYPKTPGMPQRQQQQQQEGNFQSLPDDQAITLLAEAVDNIASLVDTLAKNQDFLINAQDRTNEILERQANAIEEIVQFLYVSDDTAYEDKVSMTETPEKEAEMDIAPAVAGGEETVTVLKKKKDQPARPLRARSAGDGLLSRDEVMEIVYTMRDNGATYDEVAQHLIKLGQPTFSGRGEWHAQTIHRLCTRKK